MIAKNSLDHQVVWGKDPNCLLPELLIVASASMKEQAEAYGDLVHFEILYDRLYNTAPNG